MTEQRNAFFLLLVGTGFFIIMYQWITTVGETIR